MKKHLLFTVSLVCGVIGMMGGFWPSLSSAQEGILTDDATVALAKPARSSRMAEGTLRVVGPLGTAKYQNAYLKFGRASFFL